MDFAHHLLSRVSIVFTDRRKFKIFINGPLRSELDDDDDDGIHSANSVSFSCVIFRVFSKLNQSFRSTNISCRSLIWILACVPPILPDGRDCAIATKNIAINNFNFILL